MKTITLKLDLYSKIILTIIAIVLIGLFLQGFNSNQEAKANPEQEVYVANPEYIAELIADAIVNRELQVEVTNGYSLGYYISLWLK